MEEGERGGFASVLEVQLTICSLGLKVDVTGGGGAVTPPRTTPQVPGRCGDGMSSRSFHA